MQSVREFFAYAKNSVSTVFDRKSCGDLGSEGKAFPSGAYMKVRGKTCLPIRIVLLEPAAVRAGFNAADPCGVFDVPRDRLF